MLATGSGGATFDVEELRRKNPASSEDTLQPGQVFAGFSVLAILGRGGMGEVYLAREDFTDRMVALKVLPIRREASQDAQERMRREAAAGVRLDHPNVVRVYGGGLVDGKVYISMEWLQNGKTLREILTSGSVAVESAVAWAVQIADALDAMHRGNVWHRDLKPENVIVAPGGAVKLIDFGLARVRTENLKTTKPPNMGTPHYMAPEQMDDSLGANDGRVDVYALGLILAEMLVGHHLFEDPTRRLNKQEVTIRHLVAEPPKLSSLKPSLPASLSLVVDRMLTKRPGDRPDAREIARTLAQIAKEVRQPQRDSFANARTELAMQTPPRHPTPGSHGTVPLLVPGLQGGAPQQPMPQPQMPPRTIRMESLHDAQPQPAAAAGWTPQPAPASDRTFSTDERFGATSTANPHRVRTVRDAAFSGMAYGVVIVATLLAAFVFYARVVAPKSADAPASPTVQPPPTSPPEPSAPQAALPPATAEVAVTSEPATSAAANAAPTGAAATVSPPPTTAPSSQAAVKAQPGKPAAPPPATAAPTTAAPASAKPYDPDKPYF